MKAEHYFRGFLNGWLAKNIPGSKYVEKLDQLEGKDLHVIGICRECKHWINKDTDDVPKRGECEMRVGSWWPDDGCLAYWEEKDD